MVATGQTTPVCNIYDMGGNVFELTTESNSDTYNPSAKRGGSYDDYFASNPAGYRFHDSGYAHVSVGFRLTLFL